MARISKAELARRLDVTPGAISRAIREGRVEEGADGLVDEAGATAQWLANRRRRPRKSPPPAGAPGQAPTGAAADYWQAKAERELAEARMATLREAAMRGELVNAADIELEVSRRLIALREALETLADRLAALVAAEPDPRACRVMLRDEHRAALTAFNAKHTQPGEHDANP